MEMNVKVIKKEIIKPSSPTPNHLRIRNLSLLDQLIPPFYGHTILFYTQKFRVIERTKLLKKSLSEALTRFYPLAGRIEDNLIIDCNDEGAVFLEAKSDCHLSKLLEKPPGHQVLRNLLPVENMESSEAEGCLLLVQASFFACGGLAIGVCISHKIADASALCMFIKGWAAAASGVDYDSVRPQFNASSIFPPQTIPSNFVVEFIEEKCVTKRFVFPVTKISALKEKAASESVRHPTRVEAVAALIWKCAMNASLSSIKKPKVSVLGQPLNMRKRIVPPLSDQTMGNLTKSFYSQSTTRSDIDLASLVARMRKGKREFGEVHLKKLLGGNVLKALSESVKERNELMHDGNTVFYAFTSICRFPFYGIDFGWGKPDWMTSPIDPFKNIVILIDARDGHSIEAWVTLKEEEMAIFECDQQLLAFASLNPSVFDSIILQSSL